MIKLFRIATLLWLMPLLSKAQNGVYYIPSTKQADSVRLLLLHTDNDSLKMSIYYDLSAYYTELNKDSSLYFGEISKAISNYLTAMKIAASVDNKMELSLDYMSLGGDYITLNKLDSAILLEEKARDYAVQSDYTIYLGTILQSIGNVYFLKKN